MKSEVDNKITKSTIGGSVVGRDMVETNITNNTSIMNIIMLEDKEREFVVTHNANIKPVSYFTGRETELNDLRQRVEEGRKSVLVSGMGGIGKTHICRKLFEEYWTRHNKNGDEPFKHIGYIEYIGDMGSSLQKCLKYKQQEQPEANQEASWRELEYLASDGKLLLFVDNVDKTMKEDQGLQRLNSIPGAVVLTSRQVPFSDEFEPYRIGFLSTEQCKDIYEKIRFEGSGGQVNPGEDQDLIYIIETLAGRHTITVEFLAHLAWTKRWAVKRLRDELEQKGFKLQFRKNGEFINIQEEYEKLYDLSKLTKAEQNILEAFSVFPYIPLSAEICNQWLLADAGVCEDDDMLPGLYQKGWLQFVWEQESYAMHPVFAQFIYDKCRPNTENHLELIASCQKELKMLKSGTALECRKYILFAGSIIEKLYMEKCIEQVKIIAAFGYLFYYIAEFEKAGKLYEKALEICKNIKNENPLDISAIYNNLAAVYINQGEYEKAKELYKKSLGIREKELGENHPDTAISYNNLAEVYRRQAEYEKAEELFKKSLSISKRVSGEEHPDTATSYNNLAIVYYIQCKYEKAEELHKKSLSIREKVFGENHPETAISYNNLADVYRKQGKYKKAEELYEKSLNIHERVFGENHSETATNYNNLACIYENRGEYKKAEELYKKSLSIRKGVFGENHPDTAAGYNNLAGLYNIQREYKKAEKLSKKSLNIHEKVFGKNHTNTAISYNNLAEIIKKQGEYKEAIFYYFKAYKIFILKLGFSNSYTQLVYKSMKLVYSEWNPKGNFKKWLEEKMKEEE